MRLDRLSPFLFCCLAAPAAAQASQLAPDRPVRPGQLPGTLAYNVALTGRSFDLSALSAAIRELRPADEVDRLVASYQARTRQDQAAFAAAVSRLGGVVTKQFWLVEFATIEIAPAALPALAALPAVESITPDWVLEPAEANEPSVVLPLLSSATNANNHNADYVQQVLGLKGTGFSAAILSTGLDANVGGQGRPHRTFFRGGNPVDTSGGGLGGSLIRANAAVGSLPAEDPTGPGTAAASIVAGNGWTGVNSDLGHGYDAFVVGYSLCDIAPCNTSLSVIAQAFQAATADRVRHNIGAVFMGFQGTRNPTNLDQQAADQCALVADVVVVSGLGLRSVQDHNYINGVTLGYCITDTKTRVTYSPVGPAGSDAQRTVPDMVANGDIVQGALIDNENASRLSSVYSAAANVAGAALLVKAARPATNGREMKAILLAHTESLPFYTPNAYGMGYLRDDLAVDHVRVPGRVVSGTISSTTTPVVHNIAVSQGTSVNVALTWFRHVMNSVAYSNLALKVYDGASLVAESDTPRNSYEVVRFMAPITGTLRVEVSASSLEVPSLPYALATDSGLIGSASDYRFYGNGCPGTRGIPSLVVPTTPIVGSTFTLGVAHGRALSVCGLWFGISDTTYLGWTLPFSFGALAPGCTLLASPEVVLTLATDADGSASTSLSIPNDASLLGSTLFNQALVFDAVNPLQLVFSQGGRLTIGSF